MSKTKTPICKLTEEEAGKLLDLYQKARTTPVISLTGKFEDDWSKLAWDRVRNFQIELAKKHGYDWEKVMISGTGEVFPIE